MGGLHNVQLTFELRRCRAGCRRVETLSHIPQRCPATHIERIRRHDYAARKFAKFAIRERWAVDLEPNIQGTDGVLRKPDLVLRKGGRLIVANGSINWETPEPLATHYQHKVATYSAEEFLAGVRRRYDNIERLDVLAMVVGVRGT